MIFRQRPTARELVQGLSADSRRRLTEAGFDPDHWARMAETRHGARRVRIILSEMAGRYGLPDAPAATTRDRRTGKGSGWTAQDARRLRDMLDGLGEEDVRRLAEAGPGVDALRRMCDRSESAGTVRAVLARHTSLLEQPGLAENELAERRARFITQGRLSEFTPGQIASPWWLLALVVLGGFVLSFAVTVFLAWSLGFWVALVYWLLLLRWSMSRLRTSRGAALPFVLLVLSFLVLDFTAGFYGQKWYLYLVGRQQTVTVAPAHWTHTKGVGTPHCRVTLADRHTVGLQSSGLACAAEAGQRRTAVVDPTGWVDPVIGTKATIAPTASAGAALSAGVVALLCPVGATLVGSRRRSTP